jgi:type IV pilus assembly protein PilX
VKTLRGKWPRAMASQRGVTLVVVLLFMLALTAVVLFTARSALMGEALARNQLDERLAREAAELALRDAEDDIFMGEPVGATGAECDRGEGRPLASKEGHFTADCRAGLCMHVSQASRLDMDYTKAKKGNPSGAEAWWPESKGGQWNNDDDKLKGDGTVANCETFKGGVPLGTYTGQAPLKGVARQPEYLIEYVRRSDKVVFRVTARGFGVREGTEVLLQSVVRAEE